MPSNKAYPLNNVTTLSRHVSHCPIHGIYFIQNRRANILVVLDVEGVMMHRV